MASTERNRAARTASPAAYSVVMATGITSSAVREVGAGRLSAALFTVAVAVAVVLGAGYLWRLVRRPAALAGQLADPAAAFGFFTVPAGLAVLAVRTAEAGHPAVAAAVAAVSVPAWLLLTYAVPGVLMLGPRPAPVLNAVNGSWFLWVVATEGLAGAAAVLAAGFPAAGDGLADVAVGLWGVGVVLYLALVTLVMLRLLTVPVSAPTLHPSYWIFMGATAIITYAGSDILALPPGLPVLRTTSAVLSGLTYLLWAFGAWWIPLLVIFGGWRHLLRREALGYDVGLWTLVFPLGMFAVGSARFGRERSLSFMVHTGHVASWVAFGGWCALLVLFVWWSWRGRREPRRAGPPG